MGESEELTAQDRIRLEGRREGIVQAKSETLKWQIRNTFGSLPGELESHIDEQPEPVIDEYLDCLLSDATTVSAEQGFALRNRMHRRFQELDLDVQWYVLADCVDRVFDLTPEQEARFKVRRVRDEYRGIRKMMARFYTTCRDKAREEGELEGCREILKRHLRTKFGPLPQETRAFLDTVGNKEQLNRYLARVLTEKSLDAIGIEDEP